MNYTAIILGVAPVVIFAILIVYALYRKGDIRAGYKTSSGQFFLEAKERDKKPRKRSKRGGSEVVPVAVDQKARPVGEGR